MFERFTERARQVVVLAQDESRRLGHDQIGTVHILLALVREEEGIAARVLESMGVTLEEAQAEVDRIVERSQPASTGHSMRIPRRFAPRSCVRSRGSIGSSTTRRSSMTSS